MEYNLELDKVIDNINEKNYKNVLIQLPDGLKPKAGDIVDMITAKTKAKCFIWLGSCFGGCDIPNVDVDLIVQFGHSRFVKTKSW